MCFNKGGLRVLGEGVWGGIGVGQWGKTKKGLWENMLRGGERCLSLKGTVVGPFFG